MHWDLKLLRALPQRLLARLDIVPCTAPGIHGPCVVWVASRKSRNGYGRLHCSNAKKEVQAHRFVWERLVGPIPPGQVLDHRCRNRACCAPWHLEPVTPKVNTHRGEAKLFRPPGCYSAGFNIVSIR